MALDQELLQLAQSNPVGVQSALASRRPQFAQFKGSGQSRVTAPHAPLSAPSLPSAPAGRQGLLSQVLNQMVGNLFSGQVNPEAIAAGLDSSERQGGMEVPSQALPAGRHGAAGLPASDTSPQYHSEVPPPETSYQMPPDSAEASPDSVYSYARSKGASHEHAIALVANAKGESSFNPNAVGDNGNSFGLFQWNGPRKKALFNHYGGKAPTWQQQIDYVLSGVEPESKEFLNRRFESPQEASKWFTYKWERPLHADKDASVRASWVPQLESQIDVRMAGDTGNAGMAIPSGDPMTGRATLPPVMDARPPGFDESQGVLSSIYQDLQKGPDAPSRREQAFTSPFFAKLGQFGAMTGLAPLTMPLAIGGQLAQQREKRYEDKVKLGLQVADRYTQMQNAYTNYQHAARAGWETQNAGRITPEIQARGAKPQMFRDRATGETHAAYFDSTDQRWHNADNGQAIQIPGTWETMGASSTTRGVSEPTWNDMRTVVGPDGTARTMTVPEYQALPPDVRDQSKVYTIGTEPKAGAGAGAENVDAKQAGIMLESMRTNVIEPLQKNPAGQMALGTLGDVGGKIQSGVKMGEDVWNRIFGTEDKPISTAITKFYGDQDPAKLNSLINIYTQTVARNLVDRSGPLSTAEQDQARRLLGLREQQGGWLAPDDAWQLLQLTYKTLGALAREEGTSSGGASSPPSAGGASSPPSSSSQPSGEGWVKGADGKFRRRVTE